MNRLKDLIPKWQKELDNFKGIKSTFIIEGNINDYYPTFEDNAEDGVGQYDFFALNRAVSNIFNAGRTNGHYELLFCDPLFGFSDPLNNNITANTVERLERKVEERAMEVKAMNGAEKREVHSNSKMIKTSEIIREALTQTLAEPEDTAPGKSLAVVVNFAAHYLTSVEGLSVDDTMFFLNLLYASKNAIRGNKYINTLILVVDRYNDIPPWFFLNNPNVRTILIPNPNRIIRELYITKYFKALEAQELSKIRGRFTDLTDGMRLQEIGELRRLHQNLGLSIEEIGDAVSIYKYGFKDNPWEMMRTKLSGDILKNIERRVMGQRTAAEKIVRVIKRSVMGLSGLQHSSESMKPRGILFLAGPTGTGKTEMVKTVTELLFEDEKVLIRFDMSEYSAEHSDQKLFGAPPGYVGYDSGGQLTNRVRNNPFSILLFDEIEKAHPNIMDKFLQILEDGRMTDGQGNTVYFSETLIFFTSNVGISVEMNDPVTGRVTGRKYIVHPGEPYEDIEKKVEDAMKNHFKPEVLNRIGENIVVFDFISREASDTIVSSKLNKIISNIFRDKKLEIRQDDQVMELFYSKCRTEKIQLDGGRGIGNELEEFYINPLAEFIFDEDLSEGDIIHVGVEGGEICFRKG